MSKPLQSGVCRYCGCDDAHACRTPPLGEPCAWLDRARTVCSGPQCATRFRIDEKIGRRNDFLRLSRNIRRGSRL